MLNCLKLLHHFVLRSQKFVSLSKNLKGCFLECIALIQNKNDHCFDLSRICQLLHHSIINILYYNINKLYCNQKLCCNEVILNRIKCEKLFYYSLELQLFCINEVYQVDRVYKASRAYLYPLTQHSFLEDW